MDLGHIDGKLKNETPLVKMLDLLLVTCYADKALINCISLRMMWAAGSLASVAMITYPAISALVSCNADSDQQGM